MAKTTNDAVGDTSSGVEQLTLEEFCTRLSATDKRVELIGAFYFVEKSADRTKDYESEYQSRFTAFVNKPV